jgi:hypothetical protein
MDPWMQDVISYGVPQMMLAPIIAAALIGGGASILGGLIGGGETHDPGRIADPMRDPLTTAMGRYFTNRVGQNKPAYEGELSAGYNETLLAAITQMMGQTEGFNMPINNLVQKFMSPAGSQGWNPVSAGWNRRPGGDPQPGGRPQGVSPDVAALIAANLGGGA